MKRLGVTSFVLGVALFSLSGCATIGDPRMIGPGTYMVTGSGATNALHNMEDKFLARMQEHCQSLGKQPLLRQNNVHTEVMNGFGDKSETCP